MRSILGSFMYRSYHFDVQEVRCLGFKMQHESNCWEIAACEGFTRKLRLQARSLVQGLGLWGLGFMALGLGLEGFRV